MTIQKEYSSDLDSSASGSAIDINGIGSVVFTAKTNEHRLLGHPRIRELHDQFGTVVREWLARGGRPRGGVHLGSPSRLCLLAKLKRGSNRLYVLHVQVEHPLSCCLPR